MTNRFSIFLDLVRFLAALSVAFYHFSYQRFSNGTFSFIEKSSLGHNAVIVFFVLSGFVIYFSVYKREQTFFDYLSKRFIRLYSVLIPALIFGAAFDLLGSSISYVVYEDKIADTYVFIRFLVNFFFLQEIQFLNVRFLSNGPLWSLGYEFWYYILFGFVFFTKSKIMKCFFVFILVFFIGLKILLLFPLWLMGVLLFKLYSSGRARLFKLSIFNLVTSSAILVFLTFTDFGYFLKEEALIFSSFFGYKLNMGYSSFYLYDYAVGLMFSVFLFSSAVVLESTGPIWKKVFNSLEGPIRSLAGCTLTLYLFHFPLMLLMYSVFSYFDMQTNIYVDLVIFLSIIVISYFISLHVENRSGWLYLMVKAFILKAMKVCSRIKMDVAGATR